MILNKLLKENIDHYEERDNIVVVTIDGEEVLTMPVKDGLFVPTTHKTYDGTNFEEAFFKNYSVLVRPHGEIYNLDAVNEDHAIGMMRDEDLPEHCDVEILRNKWMIFYKGDFILEIKDEEKHHVYDEDGNPVFLGDYLLSVISSNANYDDIDIEIKHVTTKEKK